jgi:hypothetical protein
MELLEFQRLEITNRVPLAIAKYGSATEGRAYCVDIYAWPKAKDPADPILELLCHDTREGWVESLITEYQGKRVFLRFSRVLTVPLDGTSRTLHNLYSYEYREDGSLMRTGGDFL